MIEQAKLTLASAIRALVFVGSVIGGYFVLYGAVSDRLTALETTVANARVAEIPSRLSTIEENQKAGAQWRDRTDEKLDKLLERVGDD